jgi:hypothetical protein
MGNEMQVPPSSDFGATSASSFAAGAMEDRWVRTSPVPSCRRERKSEGCDRQSGRPGRSSSVVFLPRRGDLTADIADIADKSMFPRVFAFFVP